MKSYCLNSFRDAIFPPISDERKGLAKKRSKNASRWRFGFCQCWKERERGGQRIRVSTLVVHPMQDTGRHDPRCSRFISDALGPSSRYHGNRRLWYFTRLCLTPARVPVCAQCPLHLCSNKVNPFFRTQPHFSPQRELRCSGLRLESSTYYSNHFLSQHHCENSSPFR